MSFKDIECAGRYAENRVLVRFKSQQDRRHRDFQFRAWVNPRARNFGHKSADNLNKPGTFA